MPLLSRSVSILLVILGLNLSACQGQTTSSQPEGVPADTTFAGLVAAFSEPGGYFDTDNLISNETSYQHVMGGLARHGVQGGVYIGVGPGQNFTYMAQIKPTLAFMIDIRSDNVVQHLWYKALFTLADSRLEYLCLMLGRPCPPVQEGWAAATIEELVQYFDATPADPARLKTDLEAIEEAVRGFGVSLSEGEWETLRGIHHRFVEAGLGLRFNTHGRAPRATYPDLRDLMLERDLEGRQMHYLAHAGTYRFLKRLQMEDRVIPVVGNLAGPSALQKMGAYMTGHGLTLSAFYTSNVEYYLMGQGTFGAFATNVGHLPHDAHSVIIRSFFRGYNHPQVIPGYHSTQLLQSVVGFLEGYNDGQFQTYRALMYQGYLE